MWYYAFYAGVVTAAAALVLQLGRLCVPLVLRRAIAVTDAGPVTIGAPADAPLGAARLATFLTWMAAVFLVLALILRVVATGRPPYSNMWEYLVAFGSITLILYVLFERRYQHPAIGTVAMAVVMTLLVLPEVVFSSEITPLVPALQNNRLLAIHVALMLISYSALAIAFGAAVLYLLQGAQHRISVLPTRRTLDDMSYRGVLIGFPMLALGIALGAYWGNIAWGRYWGWDPKETTALVTWFIFAAYLHARGLAKWRGARSAWLIVSGFAMIIFNIFAVNFWIAGLHSYA